MIYDLGSLRGYNVYSANGKIGTLHDFYFSSDDWKIHYLLCDAGYKMTDRIVIFYTDAIIRIEVKNKEIYLNLDKDKILASPFISSEENFISKPDLISLHEYYGWNKYWEEDDYLKELKKEYEKIKEASEKEAINNLSCTREIINQIVTADTTEIGLISNLLMEEDNWELAYILVKLKNNQTSQKLVIKPFWIDEFENSKQNVHLGKEIEDVLQSPKIKNTEEISEEIDLQLSRI